MDRKISDRQISRPENPDFQKEKRRSVVLGLGAGSFEYSVVDPPSRRKKASPWTNRPIFVLSGPGCVKLKENQR